LADVILFKDLYFLRDEIIENKNFGIFKDFHFILTNVYFMYFFHEIIKIDKILR